jgi:hypothetical membrane protein
LSDAKGSVEVQTDRVWTRMVAREASRPRRRTRVRTFSDKFPWLGPTIWFLSALYFIVQIVVASVWLPSYSWFSNSISDLGNTSCGPKLCSPRHAWMNAEFVVLGAVMAAGALLIYQEFTERDPGERLAARIGFSCLAAAGAGAALVGQFPENTVGFMHVTGAGLAIGVGTLGIFVLGLVLALPNSLRWAMRVVAPLALLALILFATHMYLGLGAGTMERIAAYPETIWLIVFGTYIAHTHRAMAPARRRSRRLDQGAMTSSEMRSRVTTNW